jgi:hypothetical protein
MRLKTATLTIVGLGLCLAAGTAFPEAQAPDYASGGDVEGTLQDKGETITNWITLVVGILSVLGMLGGGAFAAIGQFDRAKQYVGGGILGLVIASIVYGVASALAS